MLKSTPIGTKTTAEFASYRDVSTYQRPLILISPRWETGGQYGNEPLAPNETIADAFVDAILAAGGLPLMMSLTDDTQIIKRYVDMTDGIAIPGGPDVNPMRWGETDEYDPTLCCEIRDSFEFKLVKEVLEANKPLFTTCRGTQLLNVATGGTLCMDVPSLGAREGMTQWRHTGILTEPCHPVEVEPNSLLARTMHGAALIQTNSAHHCCIDKHGSHTHIVARATDGVPEAIELDNQTFCLGVQWHPEYTWRFIETDFDLWCAFVSAAGAKHASRVSLESAAL